MIYELRMHENMPPFQLSSCRAHVLFSTSAQQWKRTIIGMEKELASRIMQSGEAAVPNGHILEYYLRIGLDGEQLLHGCRNLHLKTRASARFAIDLQMASQRLRALPHVKKTKMPSGDKRRISGRKAVAIIDNVEAKFIGTIPQLHENVAGVGVTQRIGHRFLPDTEQIHLDFRR